MADTKIGGLKGFYTGAVTAGNTSTFSSAPLTAPVSVLVEPAAGATITVKLSLSTPAEIAAGTASWHTAYSGTDSYFATLSGDSHITGVQVGTAAANCVVEIRS